MVRLGLLFALVALIIATVWTALGRPLPLPPSPLAPGERLSCLSYTPFRGDEAPWSPAVPDDQIADDLKRLSQMTSCIRTYSAARPANVTQLAAKQGLKVLQGIWIGRDLADNRQEIEAALMLARRYPGTIQAFVVGNETLLRGELGADKIKSYLEEVRRRSRLPVTYADVWEFWLRAPELASAVDFITIHILPYWEDQPVTAEGAVEHVREVREKVAEAFPDKEIMIGEVGWPSAGRMRGGALPSPANQALVLSGVVAAAKAEGWKVNLIEAFNQPWKRMLEGTPGGYWGLFDDATREPKFHWGEAVSNHPEWRLEAGLGIAFLVFVAAWLSVPRHEPEPIEWRKGFAIASIAATSGLVFGSAALSLLMEPPEFGDQLRSAAMLALSLLVPVVAGIAVARSASLEGLAVALNTSLRRRSGTLGFIIACLFAATLVAAIHIALGLVFDPRYKDFQFALLSGPVAALAILALVSKPVRVATVWPNGSPLLCSSDPPLLSSRTRGSRIGRRCGWGACSSFLPLPRFAPHPRQAEHEQGDRKRREARIVKHNPKSNGD
jgi:exo-beta-1,3-glucanase (GH17 family)